MADLLKLPAPTTQNLRRVRRKYTRMIKSFSPEKVIDLSLQLLRQPGFDHRFVAYELVSNHPSALRSLREKELSQLGHGIDSWGAVDSFACYLAGPAWRERQVSDKMIHGWARSDDRWWRRAALVSTVALNSKARGGSGDSLRTLRVCRMLPTDRDDMVVKAMSWALRELSKRDPERAREFLEAYKHVLAPRVVREVENKLRTGLKNPRKNRSGRMMKLHWSHAGRLGASHSRDRSSTS